MSREDEYLTKRVEKLEKLRQEDAETIGRLTSELLIERHGVARGTALLKASASCAAAIEASNQELRRRSA